MPDETTDREAELRQILISTSGRQGLRPSVLPDAELSSLLFEYEQVLETAAPDSVERHYLQRQRLVAEAYPDQASMCRLVNDFIHFDREQFYWHADYPYLSDGLTYRFALYLMSFADPRRSAIERAMAHYIRDWSGLLEPLPVVLPCGGALRDVHAALHAITDYVRRYRGPTGREPPVEPWELQFAIAPATVEREVVRTVVPFLNWSPKSLDRTMQRLRLC